MDKKQGVPKSKGLPVIGEKERGVEIVQAIMAQLDPVISNILNAIDGLERRLAVVEEVKQLFPSHIDVVIKKEEVEGWQSNLEGRLKKLETPGK